LRHRFPHVWAKVQAGTATPWRACKIATACLDLSHAAAATIDKRLARIVDTVTPHRLDTIVKAAKAHADPDAARAEAEQKARERGVYVGRSDDHGTKTIYIRAASGDVIRFDATIASIADALKVLGDTTNQRTRRAKAIGIIADPAYTEELLLQARNASYPSNPTVDDEADRDAPHPSQTDLPDPAVDDEAGRDTRHPSQAGLPDPAVDDEADRDAPHPSQADLADPAVDDEADRDAPHPSQTDLPDPLDAPPGEPVETVWPDPYVDPEAGDALTPDAQRALDARLAQIKHDAHTNPRDAQTTPHDAHASKSRGRLRPGKTEIYVHLTDHTLATGNGVLRAETLGPLLADQLTELVGHGPYTVKPVIDLNDAISVDAYEIPDRIRERIKLAHPVELFPYGNRETSPTIDLDHIQPYDPLGPPGQTNTANLAPLGRFSHRVKTHGRGWNVRRVDRKTVEWTTPHGFTFHVTPTGTTRTNHHPQHPDSPP
ncbi:hypothetical protein EV652_1151, partial [Kribbella steppae]